MKIERNKNNKKRFFLPSGMYAISLHGSNNEYLAPLDKIFCAAPIITASISGVVPSLKNKWLYSRHYIFLNQYLAVMGANAAGKSVREKKTMPVVSNVIGVIKAAVRHPNFRSMNLPATIIIRVTKPVSEEKLPMNTE
jgi:hypothetical protein